MDVEDHGAGGVGDVCHVNLAAGEVPHQPAVDRAETELSALGLFGCAGDVAEYPAYLGGGEIRVRNETGLFPDFEGHFRGDAFAELAGSAVLPHNGVAHRLAGCGVPNYGGLPLVGDAYGRDVEAVDVHLGDGFRDDGGLAGPDVPGVVLDPARTGEMLGEFLLCYAADIAFVVEDYGSRGAGSLVQGEDVFFHSHKDTNNMGLILNFVCYENRHFRIWPHGSHG